MSNNLYIEYLKKIEKIEQWAESNEWFETDFIDSVKASILKYKNITEKQKNAIDNILSKCVMKPKFTGENTQTPLKRPQKVQTL